MQIKTIFSYTLFASPRVLNLLLTVFITPLFFQLWGDNYSYFIAVSALVGFSTVVSQPIIVRYFENDDTSVGVNVLDALVFYIVFYFFLVSIPLGIYLGTIGYSFLEILSGCLFPLAVGGVLVARSSYYKFDRVGIGALFEALFLLIKIPIGYGLTVVSLLTTVTEFVIYFEICCLFEVLVLLAFASDKVQFSMLKSLTGVFSVIARRYGNFAQLGMVHLTDALIGNLDRILLAAFQTPQNLILYSFSLTTTTLLYILPVQINMQSQRRYFEISSDSEVWKLIFQNMRELLFVTILPFLVFLIFGKTLLSIWLGKVVEVGGIESIFDAASVLMIGAVFNTLCGPLNNYLQSRGRFKVIYVTSTLSLATLTIGLLVAMMFNGFFYTAIVVSTMYSIKFLMSYFFAKRVSTDILHTV
jgi:O-antigen/teichoic acid export membrane protein